MAAWECCHLASQFPSNSDDQFPAPWLLIHREIL